MIDTHRFDSVRSAFLPLASPVAVCSAVVVAAALGAGCSADDAVSDLASDVVAPLIEAHCSIVVEGRGVKDMENDYLPHVIACENGGANLQALKAQAIAARSTAYYYVETRGSVCDSQGCQVYSCGTEPQDKHYRAVRETAGQYLMYSDTLTYGFYVAGDSGTSAPSCVGSSGSTEHWVTYNENRTSTSVRQTRLGFVHDPGDFGYGQNRGCMSQWGSRCLENQLGYGHLDILRFYYGADINVIQASGECVDDGGGGGDEPPGQVTGLSPDGFFPADGASVELSWNPSPGATAYDVTMRYWDGSSWLCYQTWETTANRFTAWPQLGDTYYAFAITAKNSRGEAPLSQWAYFQFP